MTQTFFPQSMRFSLRNLLKFVAAFVLLILLLTIYGERMIAGTPTSLQIGWIVLGPALMLSYRFASLIFASQWWFLTGCGIGVLLALWLMRGGRVPRSARPFTLAALGLMLAAPVFVLWMYGPFSLPIQLRAGYQIAWLTEPGNMLSSAIKSSQESYDIVGCRYTLHGWSANNVLYYGSDCAGDMWRYDPLLDREPQPIEALPADFEPTTQIIRWDAPTGPQPPSGITNFTITFEKTSSPDGGMEAAVVQRTFYGPLDVIVVNRPGF